MKQIINNNTVQINQNKKLNPYYIAGLIHADGNFSISTQKKNDKIWLSPRFNLTLEKKHEQIIKNLIVYFNTGYYRIDNKGIIRYTVSNIKDLINIIIPFFIKYQVYGSKYKSFIMFKIICEKIYNKEHYNNDTLYYLINTAHNMNKLNSKTKKTRQELTKYLNTDAKEIVLSTTLYYNDLININMEKYKNFNLNIDFIKGLFDGDGNITINLTNNNQIRMNFNIVQYKDDYKLLKLIKEFFDNKGNIYLNEGKNTNPNVWRYETKSILNINNHILPKFNNWDNGINCTILLYKLKLIKDLIDWMKLNKINKIENKEQYIKYLNFKYYIFNNTENLTLNQYINKSLLSFNNKNI